MWSVMFGDDQSLHSSIKNLIPSVEHGGGGHHDLGLCLPLVMELWPCVTRFAHAELELYFCLSETVYVCDTVFHRFVSQYRQWSMIMGSITAECSHKHNINPLMLSSPFTDMSLSASITKWPFTTRHHNNYSPFTHHKMVCVYLFIWKCAFTLHAELLFAHNQVRTVYTWRVRLGGAGWDNEAQWAVVGAALGL